VIADLITITITDDGEHPTSALARCQ